MRFPVGKNNTDFLQNWYDAQPFGTKTEYGFHEAADLNSKSGGTSDLGKPVYAIADGVTSSVHTHTTIPTFGKHIHIRHDKYKVWSHYCHLLEMLVGEGQNIKEGQLIGYVGMSGTTASHLHFAIKKKAVGVDAVAKTLTQLNAGWLNPIEFITNTMKAEQSMPEEYSISVPKTDFENLVSKATKFDQLEKDIADGKYVAKEEYEQRKVAYEEKKKELDQFVEKLASQVTTIADKAEVIAAVERMLTTEDEQRRSIQKLQDEFEGYKQTKQGEIDQLMAEIKQLRTTNETQAQAISDLEKKVTTMQEVEKSQKAIWSGVENILNFFRRKPKR